MPTLNEAIPNRALSGSEVKALILEDFERSLAAESLLADHLAYGRISWRVDLTLHIGNQFIPVSTSFTESKSVGTNMLEAMPEMEAIEKFPLNPPPADEITGGISVERTVESPNAERLRSGLPVPADIMLSDGTYTTKHIQYPATGEAGDVKISDSTDEARAKLNKPPRNKQ
jgi:hypothetical protein